MIDYHKVKKCNRCGVEKDISDFSSTKSNVDGLKGHCKVCHNAKSRHHYNTNRKQIAERRKVQYDREVPMSEVSDQYPEGRNCSCCGIFKSLTYFALKSKRAKYGRKSSCKVCVSINSRQYYADNTEYVRGMEYARYNDNLGSARKTKHDYYQNNKSSCNARGNKYRAIKLHAVPKWADLESIKEIYLESREKSLQTGTHYHVDHIVPLQSKLVCGLHVEYNLQILSAKENMQKSNSFWPSMPN